MRVRIYENGYFCYLDRMISNPESGELYCDVSLPDDLNHVDVIKAVAEIRDNGEWYAYEVMQVWDGT